MYSYKDYNGQDDTKSEKDKLLKHLSEIESAFKLSAGNENTADIKKKDYDLRTLDDVKSEAIALLADYQNGNKQAIKSDYDGKKATLNDSVQSSQEQSNIRKADIESYTKNAKQNASDDALKRGLSRSSIVVNKLAAFDKNQIDEFAAIDKEISNNISKLESQIGLLEVQKQNALNNFDITYASKLEDKINSINDDLEKYNDSVVEYNNKIEQQEREYEDKTREDLEKHNREVYEFLDNYGGNNLENRLSNYKAEYVVSYLKNMSKEEALNLLNESEEIKNALGSTFESVLKKISQRIK